MLLISNARFDNWDEFLHQYDRKDSHKWPQEEIFVGNTLHIYQTKQQELLLYKE